VRLFTELQERNRALTDALEQQTATSEILRVIASSPTDLQAVLDAVAESAARLCEATDVLIHRVDGQLLPIAASAGSFAATYPAGERFPITRGSVVGRAVMERKTIHVHDLAAESDDEFPVTKEFQRRFGHRTILTTPLMREGMPLGAIWMRRTEVRPFTDKQIKLLETFADQAVIAIENARLFRELQQRNRDLTEALEQQTATAEILRTISSSPTDLRPVLDTVARAAARFCGAQNSAIARLDGDVLRLAAAAGPFADHSIRQAGRLEAIEVPLARGSVLGRAVVEGRTVHVHDLRAESEDEFPVERQRAQLFGHRTMAATPLLREGVRLGAIALLNTEVRPFSDKQLALLQTFADQAAIAIENVRLFTELQARNRALSEALDQQTATSEILRVIAGSPTDVRPVFDAIVRNAVQLCGALYGVLFRYEDGKVDLVAHHNLPPEEIQERRRSMPRPMDSMLFPELLQGAVVNIPDVEGLPDPAPGPGRWRARERERWAARGIRSVLTVPMRRETEVIGAIGVSHREVGAFSTGRVELLKTFADQAVIAIENVRLFNELQARTAELSRSVERLTALEEVGRAVSGSLDLGTVLQTIVSRATQLAGADAGIIYEFDEGREVLELRATAHLEPEIVDQLRATPIRKGEGASGRAAVTLEPVQLADVTAAGDRTPVRDALLAAGYRALLAVPLSREGRVLGALTVIRKRPGAFATDVLDLLRTFATQSGLAIQNARLFEEIRDKGRQLEEASRHKSQFLASMSHELRTPMNAILGYTEMIVDGIYGDVPERLREVMERIDRSGRHLLALINDVLDMSKIEAGQLVLSPSEYLLSDVVQAVVGAVEALAAEKGLALVADVAGELPLGHGDERRLRQVLLNLVGNALKFTEAGEVRVTAGVAGEMFEVSVSDTGPGIAPEDQGRIFEEFQQVDTSNTRKQGGTGLGLAIARRIVELHGGAMGVESTVGRGSRFWFTVPVRAGEASGETR
jgi:signal transduction histidine kinase